MLTNAFKKAIPILKIIERHGYEAYFVGGCVRDLFLEKEVNDIDIATSASPQMIQKIFPKVIPVGIEHGTVIVRYDSSSYEITTFYTDDLYSSLLFEKEIYEDLKRRDFTMNALALDLNGTLIDLFSGKQDIQQKIIRSVGQGRQRFQEDSLRIIRALRFVSQLGFRIESNTLNAMNDLQSNINSIAIERIYNEFSKLISGDYLQESLEYMKTLKIEKNLPIFKNHIGVLEKIPIHVKSIDSFSVFITMIVCLNEDIKIEDWIKIWKCPNKVKNEAIILKDSLDRFKIIGLDPILVYNLPINLEKSFIQLIEIFIIHSQNLNNQIKEMRKNLPITAKNQLAIKGDEILLLFPKLTKGRWIHDLIQKLEEAVVLGKIHNTKYELKEWIQCNPPVIN